MNLYDILEVEKDATNDDIIKAYKRLAKKYHPDKNKEDTNEIFKEINMAYEILKDNEKRKKYDLMSLSQQIELYDTFKHVFSYLTNDEMGTYDKLVNFFFDNENDLKSDFDQLDFNKIYNKIFNKLNNTSFMEIDNLMNVLWEKNKNLCDKDIILNLECTMEEKFNNKFKKIFIKNNQNNSDPIYVPLRENTIIYPNNGNMVNEECGDLIVNIKLLEHDRFKKINENDLLFFANLSLSEYLYGTSINIKHLDDKIIEFNIKSCIDRVPIFKIKNKGLPTSDIESTTENIVDITDDLNSIEYGDLYIWVKIIGVNVGDEERIDKFKEFIENNFPPIIKDGL